MTLSSFDEFMAAAGETLAAWWRDTRLSASVLTPVAPPPGDIAPRARADAVRAFPIVGALVGLIAGAGLMAAAWLGLHPLASALVGVTVAAGLSGAAGESGLAKFCDGLGGQTAESRLKIMGAARLGGAGALALILGVGLRAAVLAGLPGPGAAALALISAGAASRAVLPFAMARLEPARRDGLAAVGRPDERGVTIGGLLGTALTLLFLSPLAGIMAVGAAAAAAAATAALARRRLGGYTGDVLGAIQQAAELAVLIAVAASL
ncbi:MAG: adenosylcobinamide-GDP ribazoletransferase [Rhodospirillales bacterium]|jgi:adenosylcobinamide-GDP ribazoletransferase|nr:adenosylcobinamide-GDP ribazoletransferase [Rhodospirillales bacterium]